MKNVLATVGLLAILGFLALWHFTTLRNSIDSVSTEIARKTAVTRAEMEIATVERKAEDFREKARQLRIKARAEEIGLERESESTERITKARRRLAAAAKQAGLPKPSAASDADRDKQVVFASRTMTGTEVYKTLADWRRQADQAERKQRLRREMITRMRDASTKLTAQTERLGEAAISARGKLEELALQRDLVKLDTELAELGATARGEYVGDLGAVLKTIQQEIDESLATVEVLESERLAAETANPEAFVLDPEEVAGVPADDELWDD